MRTPSAPDERDPRRRRIAEHFAAIATCIEEDRPDAFLMEVLAQTQALCEEAIAHEPRADAKTLAGNVQLAVRTWQQVWPRLGSQGPFRQAVVREARMWSKRFLEGTARRAAS